jgi:hypothetical protein|tara:strand:+ start:511 stop:1002 length:492 start_codon:yes stop_codon:yes gene_type:complete
MLDQINKAFAELDDKMHVSAIEFVKEKKANWAELYDAEHKRVFDKVRACEINRMRASQIMRNWIKMYFGSEAMHDLIRWNKLEIIIEKIQKQTQAKIDRRNAQIMNALRKKEVTEIPEFKLVEYSNGVEGFFDVAGHKVHIRTILAGGYNIQCLHARTLVNIK